MRIGGLASGMDIDELVKKLMKAERAPLNKLTQKKTTYEWQRDAYRNVNTKLKTFDTYISDNLVLKSMNSKTASSSNSSLVSATATGKATGTLSIEGVSQLAESGRITGGQVNAIGSTKMKDIPSVAGPIGFSAVKADGTMGQEIKIDITDDMTVDEFVAKVNESSAGVSAVFENGRFSFTAKNTGKGSVKITEGTGLKLTEGEGASIREGKNAIFQVNGIATERSSNSFSINGYNVTLKGTFNSERATAEKYNSAYIEWKNTNNPTYNQSITDALAAKKKANTDYETAKTTYETAKNDLFGTTVISDEDRAAFNNINNPKLARSLSSGELGEINNLTITNDEDLQNWLNSSDTGNSELDSLKKKLKDENITFDQFNAIKSLDHDKLQSLSAQSMYDSLGTSFLGGLTADEEGWLKGLNPSTEAEFNAKIAEWENGSPEEKALAAKLAGLSDDQKSNLRQLSDTDFDKMTKLGTAELDQAEKLADKNLKDGKHQMLVDRQATALTKFEDAYKQHFKQDYKAGDDLAKPYDPGAIDDANMPTTTTPPVTLTSTTNVDDMMKTIKDFVDTYNGLVKDLTNQSRESKYRDYAPLTAEQREDMSESEIKLWDEKAKSGLLRNDALVRKGLSEMRSIVYQSNPGIEDSKFNSLFNIGITSSKNYNEGGTLEINETKLRKALEEDPDAVEKLFNNIGGKKDDVVNGETVDTRGYLDKLRESMKSFEVSIEKKAGRSTMTDAQYSIGQNLMDTEKRISTWQDKLKNLEARYWKQFGAMEAAINKANSQASMFMQGQ